MSADARAIASSIIAHAVVKSSWFRSATYIACYLPMHDEVDTREIIERAWQRKKRVFVPVLEKKRRMQFQEITPDTNLYPNRLGIYEPRDGALATARMLDLVLTPVVAFDNANHRVGMGGGYYDTSFGFLRPRREWLHPKLVGLAFACQNVEKITPNPWDIPLFRTVTEST